MAMDAPDDVETLRFGSQLGTQMLFRVNRVHLGAVSHIRCCYKAGNTIQTAITNEKTTGLFRKAVIRVRCHGLNGARRDK
jgi:hypothetical protein